MKLNLDPMPALKAERKLRVNDAFGKIGNQHLDQAYAQKREWAKSLDDRLLPEAELRGVSVEKLAELILSKPDTVAVREEKRQRILAKIEKAKTPAELESIFVDI